MSENPEDPSLRAAEYVLGTMDGAERVAFEASLRTEPALAAEVAAWQDRLAPLLALAPAVAPPPQLWTRLSAAIGSAEPVSPPSLREPRRLSRSLPFWRATTAAGFAVAACVAALAYLRPEPSRPVAALVPLNGTPAAFVAELQPNGAIVLTALEQVPRPDDKDLELWALPPGATRPVSLGVLSKPRAEARVATNGTQLLISLEPRGGSPTGLPTGPVLYGGTLRVPAAG